MGGFYSLWPKASSVQTTAGGFGAIWRLYSTTIAAQNLASRSRNRPAKTSFPETSARGASTPAGPSSPRPVTPSGGGFVVLGGSYTATMNFAQTKHAQTRLFQVQNCWNNCVFSFGKRYRFAARAAAPGRISGTSLGVDVSDNRDSRKRPTASWLRALAQVAVGRSWTL